MNLPRKVIVSTSMTYSVTAVVEELRYQGLDNSEITIEKIVEHVYEQAADFWGTNNLSFQDENSKPLG